MERTHTKHRRHQNNYDLYADLEKIKSAFTDAAYDVKGKTGEIFSSSVDNLKEQSTRLRDGVADYTTARPIRTIGITLLVGLALGFLIRR